MSVAIVSQATIDTIKSNIPASPHLFDLQCFKLYCNSGHTKSFDWLAPLRLVKTSLERLAIIGSYKQLRSHMQACVIGWVGGVVAHHANLL